MGRIRRAKFSNNFMTVVFYVVAGFFLALLLAFAGYVIINGIRRATPEMFRFDRHGLLNQLFDTIYIVFISLLISCPIGIFAGVYLSQYAKKGKITEAIGLAIKTLSSLPSIVVGLFGALVFLPITGGNLNLLAGALTISILSLPLITTTTQDALAALPPHYSQASLGLSATKWQTIKNVLIPACIPRIITGVILAAGRGFGETAALLFTSGMTNNIRWDKWDLTSPFCAINPLRSSETLSLLIWDSKSTGANEMADMAAAMLMILVLSFNVLARVIVTKIDKKAGGGKENGK